VTLSKLVLLAGSCVTCWGGLLIPGLDQQARTVLVIMAACRRGGMVLPFTGAGG